MRAGNKLLAVMLAAAVWVYAAMSLVPGPTELQAAAPSVVEAAASAAVAAID